MAAQNVLRGSGEMAAQNVLRGSREMTAHNVLRGSREMAAQNVLRGSWEMLARNVQRTTTQIIVVSINIFYRSLYYYWSPVTSYLDTWSHVPSGGISVAGPSFILGVFFQGVLCPAESFGPDWSLLQDDLCPD